MLYLIVIRIKAMIRNGQDTSVTYVRGASILSRREYFKIGYESVNKNRPYDYNIENKVNAVDYARGRAFAIWAKINSERGCRWKNGVLSRAGEERVLRAIYNKAVI
jgi:hypothetical protein